MATRLKKIMKPILKESSKKAYQQGFADGMQEGWRRRSMAYESKIDILNNIVAALMEKRDK